MKTSLPTSLLWYLTLLVFSNSSEALFFHTPKLIDFLMHLGGHKHMDPVHHYHMHYYPLQVPLVVPKVYPPPPPKIEIDLSTLHGGYSQMHPLDWSGYARRSLQDPGASQLGSAQSLASWSDKSQQWDKTDVYAKDHAHAEGKVPGVFFHVPFHQRIVFYQPPGETKSKFLTTFLNKLRRIHDAILHPEDGTTNNHQSNPVINNSLAVAR